MNDIILADLVQQIQDYQAIHGMDSAPNKLEVRGDIVGIINLTEHFIAALESCLLVDYNTNSSITMVVSATFGKAIIYPYPKNIHISNVKSFPFKENEFLIEAYPDLFNARTENCRVNFAGSEINTIVCNASISRITSLGLVCKHFELSSFLGFEIIQIQEVKLIGRFESIVLSHVNMSSFNISDLKFANIACNSLTFIMATISKTSIQTHNFSKIIYKNCNLKDVVVKVIETIEVLIFEDCKVNNFEVIALNHNSRISRLKLIKVKDVSKISVHNRLNLLSKLNHFLQLSHITILEMTFSKDADVQFSNIVDLEQLFILQSDVKGSIRFINMAFLKRPKLGGFKKLLLGLKQRISDIKKSKINLKKIRSSWVRLRGNWKKTKTNTVESQFLEDGIFLDSASLNESVFLNCRFPDKLFVYAVDITKVKFLNSKIPKKIESLNYHDSLSNRISALQQLKRNFDTNGDKQLAFEFQAKEMSAYYHSLSFLKKEQFLDKVNLFLNGFSNSHGRNWLYPILHTWIFGSILFYSFIGSLGGLYLDSNAVYITDDALYGYYFDWFIPGYLYPSKEKYLPFYNCFVYSGFSGFPFLAKLMVILNDAVVVPYFLYQFIAAFRRHGVK